jgi:hypothetical protein
MGLGVPSGVLALFCVLWDTFGLIWSRLGAPWDSFGPLFGYLRVTLTLLWRPWGAHGRLWRSILLEFDIFLTF